MLSPEDAATLQAHLEGVDAAAREAEAKWGFGRLPELVAPELRAKFYRQRQRWGAATDKAWSTEFLSRGDLDAVASSSAAMVRAWAVLDAAAEEAGHRPIPPEVWETVRGDGSVVAVVRTNAEASKVIADGRHVAVYTLQEVANVIDALPPAIARAKQVFPGAVLQPQRDRSWLRHGDPIPF